MQLTKFLKLIIFHYIKQRLCKNQTLKLSHNLMPKYEKRTMPGKINDIDLVELNEAFASQCLYCRDKLEIDPEIKKDFATIALFLDYKTAKSSGEEKEVYEGIKKASLLILDFLEVQIIDNPEEKKIQMIKKKVSKNNNMKKKMNLTCLWRPWRKKLNLKY